MNQDLFAMLDSLILDLLFNFDEPDLVFRFNNLEESEIWKIKDRIRSHEMDVLQSECGGTILRLVDLAERSGIPLRPSGLDIKTYHQLRQAIIDLQ